MQRSELFAAIILSIAIIITSFISAQAQGRKKTKPQSDKPPAPIGIQVAEPVNRDEAKVQVVSAGVRQVGPNVLADVRWQAVTPQGAKLEGFDVEVIGDLGNNTGVSEKRSFRGSATSGQLFLAEASKHPASEFRGVNVKIIANFRDLNNNQIFTKAAVKNFSVTPQEPVDLVDLVNITVNKPQINGALVRVSWNLATKDNIQVVSFRVNLTAAFNRGQSVRQETLSEIIETPTARQAAFNFSKSGSPIGRIEKTSVFVRGVFREPASGQVFTEDVTREDEFPPPPLPVVNLAVSELKTALNNLVSVSWTINAESQVRIIEFQIKLATTFSNNTAIISDFKATPQARSFTRSILPPDGPPNGFRQVLATITAKMEDPATGRKFDVVASRKLN